MCCPLKNHLFYVDFILFYFFKVLFVSSRLKDDYAKKVLKYNGEDAFPSASRKHQGGGLERGQAGETEGPLSGPFSPSASLSSSLELLNLSDSTKTSSSANNTSTSPPEDSHYLYGTVPPGGGTGNHSSPRAEEDVVVVHKESVAVRPGSHLTRAPEPRVMSSLRAVQLNESGPLFGARLSKAANETSGSTSSLSSGGGEEEEYFYNREEMDGAQEEIQLQQDWLELTPENSISLVSYSQNNSSSSAETSKISPNAKSGSQNLVASSYRSVNLGGESSGMRLQKQVSFSNEMDLKHSPLSVRSSRDVSPRIASPRDASPRDASPRDVLPRDVLQKDVSPRDASPRDSASQDMLSRDYTTLGAAKEKSATDRMDALLKNTSSHTQPSSHHHRQVARPIFTPPPPPDSPPPPGGNKQRHITMQDLQKVVLNKSRTSLGKYLFY